MIAMRLLQTLALLVTLAALPYLDGVASARAGARLARGWQHYPMAAPGMPRLLSPQVVAGRAGLVALVPQGYGGAARARVWVSADGRAWKSVALRAPAFRAGDQIVEIFAAGRLLLMSGYRTGPPQRMVPCGSPSRSAGRPSGRYQSLVWSSRDGTTWRRAVVPLQIGLVAPGGDGVVALGEPVGDGPLRPPAVVCPVRVWTSADGVRWRSLPNADRDFAAGAIFSLAPGGPGLVAGGIANKPGTRFSRASIWTSRNGRSWIMAPNARGVFGDFGRGYTEVRRVLAGPRGVLAFGTSIWRSPDGTRWTRIGANPFPNLDVYPGRVASWPLGFMALTDEAGNDALWSSTDGVRWTRLGGDSIFGGSARVAGMLSYRGGVAASGLFAAHPRPACTRSVSSADLRIFRPALLL